MNLRASLLNWTKRPVENLPEFDVSKISGAEFRSTLSLRGAVLVRHAVPEDIILPIAVEVERMMEHFGKIPAEVIRREMLSEDSYRRSVWTQILET